MRLTIAYTLLCAGLATATFYNGGKSGSGYFYYGAYGQNAPDPDFDDSPFQNGAANPDASNSVPIDSFIWRTNVSEVSVSDANTTFPPDGVAVLNARVISTVFDLTWQGGGNIGDALQERGVVRPYGCILMIDGLGLPENVTSKYSAADNGTCTNVLGDDCVRDFLATDIGTSCNEVVDGSRLPASCAGTLGTVKTALYAFSENLEDILRGPTAGPLLSGQGFAHILSSAYNGTNATAALQEAESRLQILLIKGLNAMACQKVNSTLTVASAPTPAGITPSSTPTNAASVGQQMSYGALGLGMFVAVLLGL